MKDLTFAGLFLLLAIGSLFGDEILPPSQPSTGPGGMETTSSTVISKEYGSGGRAFWLFEPANPAPQSAPVVVFNHGWGAMNPEVYKAWIDHIVKRGNIVIFPLYQDSLMTLPKDFTPNAIAAVLQAISVLQNEPGHVTPNLEQFAIIGHSMGGDLSANMAALCALSGLPRPKGVMCVEPGKTWGKAVWSRFVLADLAQIPRGTLLITVTGDKDHIVWDVDAKRIFHESKNVAVSDKSYVTLMSDDHGHPSLLANHFAPVAWEPMEEVKSQESPLETPNEQADNDTAPFYANAKPGRSLDALDYFGTWKLGDALLDAAFYGKNKRYAFGNTAEERNMGVWSDGVPVKKLRVGPF